MENENKVTNAVDENQKAIDLEYQNSFVPKVHNIGQLTMIGGLLLMFLPAFYLYFVCGYNDIPLSSWWAFVVFWIPMASIYQIEEHLRYYPMMGAAATYMGYLSGNASGMRLPVATSCLTTFNADTFSARGQIVAIVGVASSVVANIVVLLIIILFGDTLLVILPDVVRSALGFITVAIFGYLLALNLRSSGSGSTVKGIISSWPYLITALVGKYLFGILTNSPLSLLYILLFGLAVAFVIEMVKSKRAAAEQ